MDASHLVGIVAREVGEILQLLRDGVEHSVKRVEIAFVVDAGEGATNYEKTVAPARLEASTGSNPKG
jgi:hypothetical protein